jgi:uncharacterized protein YqgQ
MSIKDFINGPVTYDDYGQYLWINTPKDGTQMLGEIRGWGHIQYMFKDQKEAQKFQDEVGKFVADAVNEKMNAVSAISLLQEQLRLSEENNKVLLEKLKGGEVKKKEQIELDCPFDFTSRCTMGRCDCKPKVLTHQSN